MSSDRWHRGPPWQPTRGAAAPRRPPFDSEARQGESERDAQGWACAYASTCRALGTTARLETLDWGFAVGVEPRRTRRVSPFSRVKLRRLAEASSIFTVWGIFTTAVKNGIRVNMPQTVNI